MMPGMDGPELLRALRAQPGLSLTPAVFMTAKALRDEIATLKGAGAVEVISKPFDPMQLADRLRDIWQDATRTRSSYVPLSG
jgi:CheY-like chemotaxis protein